MNLMIILTDRQGDTQLLVVVHHAVVALALAC